MSETVAAASRTLGVRRYDHPMRFLVPSRTRVGIDHLVDLTSYKGAGACTCEHFQFRCAPELSRGAVPGPLLRCNHIELARDHVLSEMVNKILKHTTKQEDGT